MILWFYILRLSIFKWGSSKLHLEDAGELSLGAKARRINDLGQGSFVAVFGQRLRGVWRRCRTAPIRRDEPG
jgi:hypothetical protein